MNSQKWSTSGPSNSTSTGNKDGESSHPCGQNMNRSVTDPRLESTKADVTKRLPPPENHGWQNRTGRGWANAGVPPRRYQDKVYVARPPPSAPTNSWSSRQNVLPNYEASRKQPQTMGVLAASGPSKIENPGGAGSSEMVKKVDVRDSDVEDYDDGDDDDIYDSDEDVTYDAFFDKLNVLSLDEISNPNRQWHCPVCKGGPGAIHWYTGLQPLISHAKSKLHRVKLHRQFADRLSEMLRKRGTSANPSGEAFGMWKAIDPMASDFKIVWPPMVLVMNTQLEKEDNDKWRGMGNQELLDYFKGYGAAKAKHSYGPQGHRGMSVLIFEGTAVGFSEAERLHKHFHAQGLDREAWERTRDLDYSGGQRQLYGFLPVKEDLDNFNRHCHGKAKLKFEMRSHHEMVVIPLKKLVASTSGSQE